VYSVGDEASFESMARIRAMIIKQKADGVPVIVVGNKTDMTSSPRFISKQWAENTVVNVWKHLYMEVSATETESITQIFREIAIQARDFVDKKRGIKLPLALLNNVRRWIRNLNEF
jgi:GTPase SAR1 family protein